MRQICFQPDPFCKPETADRTDDLAIHREDFWRHVGEGAGATPLTEHAGMAAEGGQQFQRFIERNIASASMQTSYSTAVPASVFTAPYSGGFLPMML